VWSTAGRPLALDSTPADRRSAETQTGAAGETGNHSGLAGKPRPEAVAGKMWCVAELDEEYIRRMEDILARYEKPLSEREPVVCVDGKPVVLHQEIRPPWP
jgi:hypothetical protein